MFSDLPDSEIESALADNGDPDKELHTVTDIRSVLATLNTDIVDLWEHHLDAIDDGAHEIIYDDEDTIVLADHSGQFWSEQFEVNNLDDEHGVLYSAIVQLHHTLADRYCDRSWSTATPVVIEKPTAFQSGEQQVLRSIARRASELDSVAQAVDELATETYSHSENRWASLTGRDSAAANPASDD